MSIKLVFSEKIEFIPKVNNSNACITLECYINNEYSHVFKNNSKMVKLLNSLSIEELTYQFQDAPFIFSKLNDKWELVDYRDRDYKGFVQSTENMQYFIENIGFNKIKNNENNLFGDIRPVAELFQKHRASREGFDFCGKAKSFSFNLDGIKEGGDFEANLRFSWSPFESTIGSKIEIQRLICLNGMVAMTPLLDNQIRIVNNLEEHLKMAQTLIGDNLQHILKERLEDLTNSRASVYQSMIVLQHANIRSRHEKNNLQLERLRKIAYLSNPRLHISSNTYKDKVYFDDNLSQLAPSHLSKFDVWNMLTEIDTYTTEVHESSSLSIQRSINRIMFEDSTTAHLNTISKTNIEVVADHNRAFFGKHN